MPRGSIIITGANRGIGWATAEGLAAKGRDLVLACRNLAHAQEARQALLAAGAKGRIDAKHLDLSSLASIRGFAAGLENEAASGGFEVEALINNAAVLADSFSLTEDGFELSMAVNYLGPFLLSRLLFPLLKGPAAKIVNTCSSAFRIGRIPDGFGLGLQAGWHPIRAYADSKLALLMFSLELSRRGSGRDPRVYALDPGIANTGMIRLHRWFDPLTDALFRPLIQTEEGGATGGIRLALSMDGEYQGGGYYRDRRRIRVPARARRSEALSDLYDATEAALGLS